MINFFIHCRTRIEPDTVKLYNIPIPSIIYLLSEGKESENRYGENDT
ncbi:hypothetical protein CBFG_00396 [Clostridiales bacterium 1_7_47FAA]|nr:hypothetical protein CBFG_00396 [Clostridiales bacterium 1_7_47FAA]